MNRVIKSYFSKIFSSLVFFVIFFLTELIRKLFGVGNDTTFQMSVFFAFFIVIIFAIYEIIVLFFYNTSRCQRCRKEILTPKNTNNTVLFCPHKEKRRTEKKQAHSIYKN